MPCRTCGGRRAAPAPNPKVAYMVVSTETGGCLLKRADVCRSFVSTEAAEAAAAEAGVEGWSVLPVTIA